MQIFTEFNHKLEVSHV